MPRKNVVNKKPEWLQALEKANKYEIDKFPKLDVKIIAAKLLENWEAINKLIERTEKLAKRKTTKGPKENGRT